MLVRKWRERNGRELSGLQPMHSCCINGNCFFWSDIWTIFQIIVLSFLACKNAKNNYREPKEQATRTKDKKWRIQYLCECNMRAICPYYIKKKEKQKKKKMKKKKKLPVLPLAKGESIFLDFFDKLSYQQSHLFLYAHDYSEQHLSTSLL